MNQVGRQNVTLLALLAASVIALFPAGARAEQPTSSQLTVSWVACSDNADPTPFFTVEVARSGAVRYLGGELVRLQDERVEQVSAGRATKIFRLANDLLTAHSQGRVAPLQSDVSPYFQYCLRIGFDATDQSPGIRVSGHSRPAAALRKQLDSILDTPALVCPTPILQLVEKGYCGKRQVGFSLDEFKVCVFRHEVLIFADGRGAYYVFGEKVDYTHFTLSRAQMRELANATKNYTTDFVAMPQARGGGTPSSRTRGERIVTNPSRIIEFKAALERIAGIRWHTPATSSRCEPRAAVDGVIAIFR